ncbi:MAG TPA: DNA polymerase IV [candidate division Zixibacteria bacterium]|nr:DNA polymerase IV [candidate division Zixibacteria bacterium]
MPSVQIPPIKDHSSTAVNNQSTWPKAILHLDMDAFFVNVHILAHPEDAGIPLAVGGHPGSRGVIASASYEARKFGVRSALPSSRALRLCPQLKIVGHTWSGIQEYSQQVMDILAEYGPVEKMSVDEAYVDLTGVPQPEDLAQTIRRRVKKETGLPASVGLATSKLVAKVSSDFDKPEGCTIVRPGDEEKFLAPQSVRVIMGIGPRTAERLAELKITTCGELARADLELLRQSMGNQAEHLQRRALGKDSRSVRTERGQVKSISQERTFSEDVNDPQELANQILVMAASVSKSLQKRNLVAHTIRVKFRWADFTTFTRQRSVIVGIDDEDRISQIALAIWSANWSKEDKLRLLGVGVAGLEELSVRQFDFGF